MPPINQFVPPPKSKPSPKPTPPVARGVLQGVARAVAPPPSTRPSGIGGTSVGTLHAVARAVPHNPGGDIQSSGAGYGSAQANAYKRTASYRQAIIDTFLHQSKAQQKAITNAVTANPKALESKIIIGYLNSQIKGLAEPKDPAAALKAQLGGDTAANALSSLFGGGAQSSGQQLAAASGLPTTVGAAVAPAADKGLAVAQSGLNTLLGNGPRYGTQVAGFNPAGIAKGVVNTGIDMARATVQDPSTLPRTVKGLGETTLGSAAAIAELPYKVLTLGPGKAIDQFTGAIAKDYSQRYGGSVQQQIDYMKKHGFGTYLLDALGVAGGLDATAGRAIADLGKGKAAFSGSENLLTRGRPALRISGSEVRDQHLAPAAGRIIAQRIEDKLRAAHGGKELPLKPHEVAPLFQGRAIRVLASAISARHHHLMQGDMNREVRAGQQVNARKLLRTKWERRAAPIAVEGTIPLRSGERAAYDAIDRHKDVIKAERARLGQHSPGNRIPKQFAGKVDDLALLNDMQANISKWLTPGLASFVDKEAARTARLGEHPDSPVPNAYLTASTAEARRLRAQGEVLGHVHPDVINEQKMADLKTEIEQQQARVSNPRTIAQHGAARAALRRLQARMDHLVAEHDRPAQLHAYSARVRADAQTNGLPEPAFYGKHVANPKQDFGAWTPGGGHAGMPAPKRSQFTNWRNGVVYRDLQHMFDSTARTVKAGHQWRLVSEQFDRNALPTPTRLMIRNALGHNVHAADLTGRELAHVLAFHGVDLKNVKFYNPNRLSEAVLHGHGLGKGARGSRAGSVPGEMATDATLHEALSQHERVVAGGAAESALQMGTDNGLHENFVKSAGWRAIPKSAFDEIHANLKPSGAPGRAWGKFQGGTAGLILGMSPSFVIMNTVAHAYLAAFGTRGRMLTDAVKFPIWWHGLTDAERNIVRAHAGGRGEMRAERMGSTAPVGLRHAWKDLQNQKILHAISSANPARLFFKAEDLQSNFFRHMVYYHATKRAAFQRMNAEVGPAAAAMNRLQHVFDVGPKDRMAEIIAHQADAEALGRHTVNMMGDYSRFSAAERKWLNNRGVLFYSFLRHATRTLLYVLPVHHPLATALVGEMANLHNQEVQKMLGGQDLPWAYSRLYFTSGGKLTSIDFARSSPVSGAIADTAAQGIAGAGRLIAPEIAPLLDMIYAHRPDGTPVPTNVWTALNGYLSLSYPYRAVRDAHNGMASQNADSIPWIHERPTVRKTASSQAYQAAKEAASGPLAQKMLAGLIGAYPKPDDTAVIAQHRAATAAGGAGSTAGTWRVHSSGAGGYRQPPSSTRGYR